MQLTQYTDYSFRALVYLAGVKNGELATVMRISEHYEVSYNHLVKVIQELRKHGYVQSVRGRTGGIRLAKATDEINLYDIMHLMRGSHRSTHNDQTIQMDKLKNHSIVKPILDEARKAFNDVLKAYTLEDLIQRLKLQPCL